MFKFIRDACFLRRHYAAYYDGKSLSFSWLTHTRFLQVPINQGAKQTLLKRPGDVSDEETKVVFEKMRKAKGSYGNDVIKRVGFAERTNLLVDVVLKLKDSKEVVYGALDSWVAREQTFPLNVLKRALYLLEKKQQWHRIIQVIKWMLSKGQCTMNTYEQLLRALDKEQRSEEAHAFWEMRIGSNLHSVPWHLCTFMICLYQRNNMPERLIKLFNDLERSNRKPPDKSIIKAVADAYELLGLLEEQERVLNKYRSLFKKPSENRSKKNKEKTVQDGNGANAGQDELLSGGNSSLDELLLEKVPSICDAGSNSSGNTIAQTSSLLLQTRDLV